MYFHTVFFVRTFLDRRFSYIHHVYLDCTFCSSCCLLNIYVYVCIFQDVLSALKLCLSCDEAFQYAEYVSIFAGSQKYAVANNLG